MPGTLLREKDKLYRSDSDSSLESKKVSFNRNVRIKPFREKYTSNGLGVTKVNLNESSRTPPPRLDNDTLVNRFARRVENDKEIEYVTPEVNNRYVTSGGTVDDNGFQHQSYLDGDVTDKSKSQSVRNGGDLLRTHPSQKPAPPPDVQRNHVWNIVNQFDRESKQKYVCQQTDSDGEGSSTPAQTIDHLDMNKSKKNPIANGIKVIFGLKSSTKQEESPKGKTVQNSSFKNIEPIGRDRSKQNGFVSKSDAKRSNLSSLSATELSSKRSDLQERSKKYENRLELLRAATKNNQKGKKKEMSTRALSPDDVTDGYSTSKTFEYYDSKGIDDYDTIREEYLNKYRDPYGSWRGSPDIDIRYDDDRKPPTPPRNVTKSTGNLSTQKTRLANGASEYVFKSSDGLNRSVNAHDRSTTYKEKRDVYKSTGDLEYRSNHYYDDRYGSKPDIRYKSDYSDDDRSPSPLRERLIKEEYPIIMEDDTIHGYRRFSPSPYGDDLIEREGDPLPERRFSDNRYPSMERLRRSPTNDFGSSRYSREHNVLERSRGHSPRGESPDVIPFRKYRHASGSSVKSSGEKYRSWEKRARERGSIQRLFSENEPTYSTIDKKNKTNRQLHYPSAKNERETRINRKQGSDLMYQRKEGSTFHQSAVDRKSPSPKRYVDDEPNFERPKSRHRSGEDPYYESTKRPSSQERPNEVAVDRYRSMDRTTGQRDRSSSQESLQRQTESSHQKQVIQDGGFDHTIEEDKYQDVTVEKVDNDTDTEEVVDVTADVKTEEYEKDGHYHKNHKQSNVETKTFKYTNPDIIETLRRTSKPVQGDRRIADKPYNEDIYGRRRQIDVQNKSLRDLADVKTSIEKTTDENRYREGTNDITDKKAVNRAIVETGTIDRQNVKDGHRDTVIRDRNDYNQTVERRFTCDDSDPMRKLRTNATVDQVDHYRTIDERNIVEKMEKKPSLARSRHQLKQIEAADKSQKTSKSKQLVSSIGQKFKSKREKDTEDALKKEKGEDAVYTKVKKSSKLSRKLSDNRSSDDENYRSSRTRGYVERERDSSCESLHKTPREASQGRYRDLTTRVVHVSSDHHSDNEHRKPKAKATTEKMVEKTYHQPVQANIQRNSSNGWSSQRKQVYTAGDSSSPSPPLHKRSTTLESRKSKSKLSGKRSESTDLKQASRTDSSAIDQKNNRILHHFKQYRGKNSPAYPSIRITTSGKENGEISDGQKQKSSRSNKFQRPKLPMSNRHGSVDRLDETRPNQGGYYSSTLQHVKKSNDVAVKRSNSSAATMPPVQRLRNNRGFSPLRTKNHTSSSADSVAGESTTSSKRAVGFYIPGVNNSAKNSMDDLSVHNSAVGVSRAHSMMSSKHGGSKKYMEKSTTYAMAQPQRDQVEKDDEIYGSTTVIDYSKIDEEDENQSYQKSQKNKKLKRTASLPKDTRFPWPFRRKKTKSRVTSA